MRSKYRISLVIPVYNEEQLIEGSICLCNDYLASITDAYEIVVVDDGSKDQTSAILDRCALLNPKIKIIHNKINLGSGKSLFIGLKESRYDFVVTNFADLPFNIKELEKILPLFNNKAVDFVVVSRRDRKANSIYRKVTSLVNYWLIRLIFNVKVADFQFVQVYRKKVLDTVDIKSTGTFVPPEIIIKSLKMGFKMEEYSTCFYPRRGGSSKCGGIWVIMTTIIEMTKFWVNCQFHIGKLELR